MSGAAARCQLRLSIALVRRRECLRTRRGKGLCENRKNNTEMLNICTTFDTAPYEYEAVAAVSLGGAPRDAKTDAVIAVDSATQGVKTDAVIATSAGEELQIGLDAAESGASSELYSWTILMGDSLIELSNSRSQICTVRACAPGIARLKLSYAYASEGTNALKNRSGARFLSKTREYGINIAP